MPRPLRIQYPGAIYHALSRGDRREDIFVDDIDRHDFLKTLAEACQKTGWQVHAYCLMRNHFHLVLETPDANLVAGMRWLLSAYTLRLNHRHKLFGHVFSGRYKALLVDGARGGGYLKTVCDYVHLNPARARLLKAEDKLSSYPWSSLGWYLTAREHRPFWMRVDRLLGEHGIKKDNAAGRQEWERRLEARRLEEEEEATLQTIRRGWCLGSPEFKKQALALMDGKVKPSHGGELQRETAQARAERIIAAELAKLAWSEQDLAQRRKNDPGKLALAARLRKETTLTIKEIARRLTLGTSRSANAKLHRWMKADLQPTPPSAPVSKTKTSPRNQKQPRL